MLNNQVIRSKVQITKGRIIPVNGLKVLIVNCYYSAASNYYLVRIKVIN